MENQLREQLLTNNELLLAIIDKLSENNQMTLEQLQEQKQINTSLIQHLKSLYEQLDKIPIKTQAEEIQESLLINILLDFWDYR